MLPTQLSFSDVVVAQSLRDTTFVVVDLETTGTNPRDDRITEIGAVKVRGGEILGELATLVDPGRPLPPQIVSLTGITEAMVCDAPRIEEVLPSFLEFARGATLVAHNARFDMGFLRATAERCALPWPFGKPLCTVRLARRVLTREEAPTVRLGALAQLFRVSTLPTHRALDDARATVEVLHALLERVGNQGIHTTEQLHDYLPGVPRQRRAKRSLAHHLPEAPGVYLFMGPRDEVLYVGTAVDLRRRVSSYFTGSETRARMNEMVALATRVDHVECAHSLEAGVRELRLLAAHTPAFNRKSKFPHKGWWVCLSDEPQGRLSVSRSPSPRSVGPIPNRAVAADLADLLAEAARLRTCRTRRRTHDCPVEPIGGCYGAGRSPEQLAAATTLVADTLAGCDDILLLTLFARLHDLAERQLYANAARLRDRLSAAIDALARCQRLSALSRLSELVVARPDGFGGWDLAVVRHGRLAAAGRAARGVPPMPVVEALAAAAETVIPSEAPLRGASAYEAALLWRWVCEPTTRIVCGSSGLSMPARGAEQFVGFPESGLPARALPGAPRLAA